MASGDLFWTRVHFVIVYWQREKVDHLVVSAIQLLLCRTCHGGEVPGPTELAARVTSADRPSEGHRARLRRRLYTEQLEVSVTKVSSEKTEKREDRQEKRRTGTMSSTSFVSPQR